MHVQLAQPHALGMGKLKGTNATMAVNATLLMVNSALLTPTLQVCSWAICTSKQAETTLCLKGTVLQVGCCSPNCNIRTYVTINYKESAVSGTGWSQESIICAKYKLVQLATGRPDCWLVWLRTRFYSGQTYCWSVITLTIHICTIQCAMKLCNLYNIWATLQGTLASITIIWDIRDMQYSSTSETVLHVCGSRLLPPPVLVHTLYNNLL